MDDKRGTADRLEIRELIEAYSAAITRKAWAELGPLFHPDGEWRLLSPYDIEAKGRDVIAETIPPLSGRYDFIIQAIGWTKIELDGDRAASKALIHEYGRTPDGATGVHLYGVYDDALVRQDGRWMFKSRTFTPMVIDRAPPVGQSFGAFN